MERFFLRQASTAMTVALIDEAACIGCTQCITACPVDAIIGSAKKMHTVLASACTGCGECLAPCPTNCIRLQAWPVLRSKRLERQVRQRRMDVEDQARTRSILRKARQAGQERGSPPAVTSIHRPYVVPIRACDDEVAVQKKAIIAAVMAAALRKRIQVGRAHSDTIN